MNRIHIITASVITAAPEKVDIRGIFTVDLVTIE